MNYVDKEKQFNKMSNFGIFILTKKLVLYAGEWGVVVVRGFFLP